MRGVGSSPTAALLPASLFAPLLPTESQTWLLRFCLLEGQPALDDWHAWCRRHRDAVTLLRVGPRSVRGLNLLLVEAIRKHAASCPGEVFRILRLSALKERLRTDAYRQTLAGALASLDDAGIETVLLPGAALAETIYQRPEQRHCHGINLLVRGGALDRAAATLASNGYRYRASAPASRSYQSLVHANQLPLTLHVVPQQMAGGELLVEPFWQAGRAAVVAGQPAFVLAPEDALLQVFMTALISPRRRYLRWVTDAWFLIRGSAELDWQVFVDRAHRAQVSMLSHVALNYLGARLGANVPPEILERLAEASHREPIGRDNALHTLWASTRGDLQALNWLIGGRHLRRPALRWLLLPSREYVRHASGGGDRGGLPGMYARRALNFTIRRLRHRGNRRASSRRSAATPPARGRGLRHGH